ARAVTDRYDIRVGDVMEYIRQIDALPQIRRSAHDAVRRAGGHTMALEKRDPRIERRRSPHIPGSPLLVTHDERCCARGGVPAGHPDMIGMHVRDVQTPD